MLRVTTSIFLFFICSSLVAQDFTINRVEMAAGKVVLHYTLVDSVHHRNYTINVFSSKDNFIAPLDKVTGDVGLEVKPGGNKKIIWDPLEEYGKDFNGKVSIEVRGRVYIPFVRFDGFEDYKSVKRGKEYELTWSGGTPQNILNFELYRREEKITAFPNIANVGHYTLLLPTSVKPGRNYRFRITDSKNKDEIVYTSDFRVKRKVPLLVKMIPIAGVAAAVFFISSKSSETPVDNTIVDPLGTPNK